MQVPPGSDAMRTEEMEDDEGGQSDLILVCEVCEKEGPKLVVYVDGKGYLDADEFYMKQNVDVKSDVMRFVASMLSADHHFHKVGEPQPAWVVPPDCHALLHKVLFLDRPYSAFIYKFTLPDLSARGHVRPFSIIYMTQQLHKLVPYFTKLKLWTADAVSPWKEGAYRYFVSRASLIIKGTNSVLNFYRNKRQNSADASEVAPDDASSVPDSSGGSWFSRLGGLWRGAETDTEIPMVEMEKERQNLHQMILAVKKQSPDCAVEDEKAHIGLKNLSIADWVRFLTNFLEKTPSQEALLHLEDWIGQEVWKSGLYRLVLIIQVVDRSEMDLVLLEQDWRSAHQSVLPGSTLSFGGRLTLGTDLQSDTTYAAQTELPTITSVSPYSHPPALKLHELFTMYPKSLKHVVYALLKGRPVFVIGGEGTETKTGSVRSIISILRTFLMGDGEGVIPYTAAEISLQDLSIIRLCGIPSINCLKGSVVKYVTTLNAETDEYSGCRYHGKWLEELFGKGKEWDSDETLRVFVQAWLLQVGLTAAVVYHSTLLRGPLPTVSGVGGSGGLPHDVTGSFCEASMSPMGNGITPGTFDPSPCSVQSLAACSEGVNSIGSSTPVCNSRSDSPAIDDPSRKLHPNPAAMPKTTNAAPTPASVFASARINGLSDLGVIDSDADIIRYAVRFIRDSAISQNKSILTNLTCPLSTAVQYESPPGNDRSAPKPFPLIRLDEKARKAPK
eukprot:TRINITY_DN613_c0_g1_i1.p1 TRINITY_DN613_c0_g1~~TRINITY_DN613_c0_g1_i1.p1  ORF type:complete len:728 (+),score=74.68 TRINITY_DN613_c0_g1_i1:58-2241(+)